MVKVLPSTHHLHLVSGEQVIHDGWVLSSVTGGSPAYVILTKTYLYFFTEKAIEKSQADYKMRFLLASIGSHTVTIGKKDLTLTMQGRTNTTGKPEFFDMRHRERDVIVEWYVALVYQWKASPGVLPFNRLPPSIVVPPAIKAKYDPEAKKPKAQPAQVVAAAPVVVPQQPIAVPPQQVVYQPVTYQGYAPNPYGQQPAQGYSMAQPVAVVYPQQAQQPMANSAIPQYPTLPQQSAPMAMTSPQSMSYSSPLSPQQPMQPPQPTLQPAIMTQPGQPPQAGFFYTQ